MDIQMLTFHRTDTTRQRDLIVLDILRMVLSAINKSLISAFFPIVLSSMKLQPRIFKSFTSIEYVSFEILLSGSVIRLANKIKIYTTLKYASF